MQASASASGRGHGRGRPGSRWTGGRRGATPPKRKAMSDARMSGEKEKVLGGQASASSAEARSDIDKGEERP